MDVPQTQLDKLFLVFVDTFNRQYQSQADFAFRREIFKRNMAFANASMALSKTNGGNLKLGFNRFSD